MTNLDIMLIFLCIAGIALMVYVIFMLTKVVQTIEKLNSILDKNEKGIAAIVQNLDAVTTDAKTLTGKATSMVEGVEKGLKKPLTTDNISGIVSSTKTIFDYSKYAIYMAGVATTIFGYIKTISQNRKQKKERKARKKQERQHKKEFKQQRRDQIKRERIYNKNPK